MKAPKSTTRAEASGVKNPKAVAKRIEKASESFLARIDDPMSCLCEVDGGLEGAWEEIRAAVERLKASVHGSLEYLNETL